MKNELSIPMIQPQSRYFRNTWMINAQTTINFPDSSCVRFLSEVEALKLSEMIKKRNVFARISWENHFYIQRMNELANHTIIEVYRNGDPQTVRTFAEHVANLIEKIVIISTVFATKKKDFLKKLGISTKPRNELDIIIGNPLQYVSSKSTSVSETHGILLTEQIKNRFNKCGFLNLYDFCLLNGDLAKRVNSSIDWLFESRREPSLNASIIKTSIALETLLIFNDSENLSRSLSDRVALLLSQNPTIRRKLSKIVNVFYDTRSAIVHGNRKRKSGSSSLLIEIMDRICTLMYLTISSNPHLWNSEEEIQTWFDKLHWGFEMPKIVYPFSNIYLNNILKMSEKL